MGQAADGRRQDRLHRAAQRVRLLRGPARPAAICDRFGPGTVQVWFEQWMSWLALPLTGADRDAGY
jgi:hypothetical protein